jgi:hypothetical protein
MNPLNVREPTTTYIYDDFKLVKDTGASQKVETDPKTLRKTNGSNHFPCTDLNRESMKIGGNKASITNHNHLRSALFPVDPEAACIIYAQDSIRIVKVAPESTKTQTL